MPKILVAVGKIFPRIGLNLWANPSFQQFMNSEQRKILNNSQFSYTCGSEIKWPVRKFFEIPAAGAVLLCSEFNGMRDAGFIHGENCMIIDPNNIHEILSKAKKTNKFDKIARNGRDMIATSHSLSKRSEQLSVAIDKTLDASFCGADWVNGELIYK